MSQYDGFLRQLEDILDTSNVEINVPMSEHTTFKAGGNADIFVTPETYEEVRDVIKLCNEEKVKYFILGKGSNILIKDGGMRGLVVKLSKLDDITIHGNRVIAQSGASYIKVALTAAANSLKGLEFASGIPGTIGGAVMMNAGAYGGDTSQAIESALVVDDKFNIVRLSKDELELTYRNSAVAKYGYVVLEATFKLEKGNYDEIKAIVDDLTNRRNEKQPLEYASAGSTFKRPEGYFAGKLIQDSGLKGFSIGDAEVSEKHSGFIINKGNAKAKEILDLIHHVQVTVYEKFSVTLETEVRILGDDE